MVVKSEKVEVLCLIPSAEELAKIKSDIELLKQTKVDK